jgi:hypothetical protein
MMIESTKTYSLQATTRALKALASKSDCSGSMIVDDDHQGRRVFFHPKGIRRTGAKRSTDCIFFLVLDIVNLRGVKAEIQDQSWAEHYTNVMSFASRYTKAPPVTRSKRTYIPIDEKGLERTIRKRIRLLDNFQSQQAIVSPESFDDFLSMTMLFQGRN